MPNSGAFPDRLASDGHRLPFSARKAPAGPSGRLHCLCPMRTAPFRLCSAHSPGSLPATARYGQVAGAHPALRRGTIEAAISTRLRAGERLPLSPPPAAKAMGRQARAPEPGRVDGAKRQGRHLASKSLHCSWIDPCQGRQFRGRAGSVQDKQCVQMTAQGLRGPGATHMFLTLNVLSRGRSPKIVLTH